jgi:hypothetical protein
LSSNAKAPRSTEIVYMSMGIAEPKARKRSAARADVRKPARKDGRVKSTILMDKQVDFRLTTIAASLGLDRSTLATQLIEAGLRRYALDAALREFAGATPDAIEDRQDGPAS